jgi:glycosyltransferase involved in cell wall biosynthesis
VVGHQAPAPDGAARAVPARHVEAAAIPALVHDYLLVLRGAERTFAAMADIWPTAPVYTLLYDDETVGERFAGHEIVTSPLQRVGVRQRSFRALLPLYPWLAQRLPVDGHDVVVSSSSAFAHGVRPAAGATHVCYCHSPFRYAWHEYERALDEVARPLRPVLGAVLRRKRRWDLEASERVTTYVANSAITRQRIRDYFDRDAEIVHPPVEIDRFVPSEPEDYFLFVGELIRHKRVEIALEAARRARVKMKVVGTGPEMERLRQSYGAHAEFLGRVDDHSLVELYGRANALVVPNVEEFGIAAVEAQASGRPVVAVDRGGARETVVDGRTGVLVPEDDPDAMAEALRETDFQRFSVEDVLDHARRFSVPVFQERLRAIVARSQATG